MKNMQNTTRPKELVSFTASIESSNKKTKPKKFIFRLGANYFLCLQSSCLTYSWQHYNISFDPSCFTFCTYPTSHFPFFCTFHTGQCKTKSTDSADCRLQIGFSTSCSATFKQLFVFRATFFVSSSFLHSEQFLVFYQFWEIGAAFSA